MSKFNLVISILAVPLLVFCGRGAHHGTGKAENDSVRIAEKKFVPLKASDIVIEKQFEYDKYTLEDVYPYRDTTRCFQWDKIRAGLAIVENAQRKSTRWAYVVNRRNMNGQAALVDEYSINEFGNAADDWGEERYQSAPLYQEGRLSAPRRYTTDGSIMRVISERDDTLKVDHMYFGSEWLVPAKFTGTIDSMVFLKVIFIDRTNQNIATLEKSEGKWLVRSMNPVTTGLHHPPYQHETPLGIFVIMEKRPKMIYYRDGTTDYGGFAPYASRFTNGAYLHGVPVNAPGQQMVEWSPTLGTTPRSHKCVRNATSHAKFLYEWAPLHQALVYVIE